MASIDDEYIDRRPEISSATPQDDEAEAWRKRAEEIFQSLPRPPIQPLPKEHAFDLSKYQNQLGCTPAEAWQKCADAMRTYDADNCKALREEIDTLLVFAGLFSAVVTAFTVESYQWLQSDPNDAIIGLLSQIAGSGNQPQATQGPTGLPAAVSTRINAYWFLSLTLSLAAALVAILCKQWVREFERHGDQTQDQYISVRQTKLEGFERWGVASVVAAVPLLLQSALGLFALGLMELLWKLHTAVAVVVLIPTTIVFVFYMVTTLLPGLQNLCSPFGMLRTLSQCPFKSSQALLTSRVLALIPGWLSSWSDPLTLLEFVPSFLDFCHRNCLVFCRRLRASFVRGRLPVPQTVIGGTVPVQNTPQDHVEHLPQVPDSFWHRLMTPWRYDKRLFYDPLLDQPNWLQFRARRQGTDPHDVPFYPGSKHRRSWLALDLEFTRQRDSAYYPSRDGVPAIACFRALFWLLEQIDHPKLRDWIWLTVWDIATGVGRTERWEHIDLVDLHQGILHLTSAREISGRAQTPSKIALGHAPHSTLTPVDLALAYALYVELDPSLTSELFVHLHHLDIRIARFLWYRESDNDIWYSGLHAMLAHALQGEPEEEFVHIFLDWASHPLRNNKGALTLPGLACMIALHFREQLSQRFDIGNRAWYLPHLLGVTLECLSSKSHQPENRPDSVVNATFSALAVAFDRWLEQWDAEDVSARIPVELSEARGRKVYFDLLSAGIEASGTSPAGVAAAAARLSRQLAHLEKRLEEHSLRDLLLRYTPQGDGVVQEAAGNMRRSASTDMSDSEPDMTLESTSNTDIYLTAPESAYSSYATASPGAHVLGAAQAAQFSRRIESEGTPSLCEPSIGSRSITEN